MRSEQYLQNFKTFVAAAIFIAAAVVVLDGPVHAQGKGHGKRGGGPPGHQKQMPRQQWGGGGHQQKQRGGGAQVHRQKQWNGNNGRAQQQQQMRVWNVQRRQNRSVQQAAQQRQYQQQHQKAQRHQQVQQRMNTWNAARQQQTAARQAQRQQRINNRSFRRQQQVHQSQWVNRNRTRQQQWNARRANNVRGRGRQVYYSPVQVAPSRAWSERRPGWTNAEVNRSRRDLKHAFKAERKAQRRFEKDRRRNARVSSRAYDNNYYGNSGNTYYFYDYGYDQPNWKQQLLQTVLSAFQGRDRHDSFYNRYDSFDDRSYERPVYYSEAVPRSYNSPIYVGYSPDYADEPEYYNSDYGYDGGDTFELGGILGRLPLEDLFANFVGDGFVSELLGNLIVQGYDEGFVAGEAAREYGYDDSSYDNPYVFEGGFCDPYSVSVGENRELLSQGYTLGYRDALNGREDYDPYSDGHADLVSTLLSGVLGRV